MPAHLKIDPVSFRAQFGREPFLIKHKLAGHALFQLPRLAELARSLPEELCEYNAGNLPVSQDPTLTPRNGLSVEETIRRIETCGSWMVLKHIERDKAYARLLDECLDQVETHSETVEAGMHRRVAFLFVSSPHAVTPLHMDPEHNFLLQIRGEKRVHMWPAGDREVLPESALERYFGGDGHRNLEHRVAFEERAWVNHLAPGEGLHFPYAAPHWVQNGGEVSVSFSITFTTREREQQKKAYIINSRLRRLGVHPRPVGASPLRDAAMYYGFSLLRRARAFVR